MADFKIYRGNSDALANQTKSNGSVWYTKDDSKLYFDISNSERQALNAECADKLKGSGDDVPDLTAEKINAGLVPSSSGAVGQTLTSADSGFEWQYNENNVSAFACISLDDIDVFYRQGDGSLGEEWSEAYSFSAQAKSQLVGTYPVDYGNGVIIGTNGYNGSTASSFLDNQTKITFSDSNSVTNYENIADIQAIKIIVSGDACFCSVSSTSISGYEITHAQNKALTVGVNFIPLIPQFNWSKGVFDTLVLQFSAYGTTSRIDLIEAIGPIYSSELKNSYYFKTHGTGLMIKADGWTSAISYTPNSIQANNFMSTNSYSWGASNSLLLGGISYGEYSIAAGQGSTVQASNSAAIGMNSYIYEENKFAIGYNLQASNSDIVLGKYNDTNDIKTHAFTIGIGTGFLYPKNGFVLDYDGKAYLSTQTLPTDDNLTIVTKNYPLLPPTGGEAGQVLASKGNDTIEWTTPASTYEIGDIRYTEKDLSESNGWLRCDGSEITKTDYPELCEIISPFRINGNNIQGYTSLGEEEFKISKIVTNSVGQDVAIGYISDDGIATIGYIILDTNTWYSLGTYNNSYALQLSYINGILFATGYQEAIWSIPTTLLGEENEAVASTFNTNDGIQNDIYFYDSKYWAIRSYTSSTRSQYIYLYYSTTADFSNASKIKIIFPESVSWRYIKFFSTSSGEAAIVWGDDGNVSFFNLDSSITEITLALSNNFNTSSSNYWSAAYMPLDDDEYFIMIADQEIYYYGGVWQKGGTVPQKIVNATLYYKNGYYVYGSTYYSTDLLEWKALDVSKEIAQNGKHFYSSGADATIVFGEKHVVAKLTLIDTYTSSATGEMLQVSTKNLYIIPFSKRYLPLRAEKAYIKAK